DLVRAAADHLVHAPEFPGGPVASCSTQGVQASCGGCLEAGQRLADQAVVDTRGAVTRAGEDPVPVAAEARPRQRLRIAAEEEDELSPTRVPETRGELARRHDPAAVRAVARRAHREEVATQNAKEPATLHAPDPT